MRGRGVYQFFPSFRDHFPRGLFRRPIFPLRLSQERQGPQYGLAGSAALESDSAQQSRQESAYLGVAVDQMLVVTAFFLGPAQLTDRGTSCSSCGLAIKPKMAALTASWA